MHRGVRESGRKAHAPRERKKRDRSATGREAVSFPPLLSPEAETEALLRSTLDSLSAHIAVLDEVGRILVAGDALGTTGGTLAGSNPQFTEDAAAAKASIAKLGALQFDILLVGHGEPILEGAAGRVAALAAGG